jgi:urease accessory protein
MLTAVRDDDDALPQFAAMPVSSWRAQLELRFAPSHGRTRLVHRRHEGPLMVQRPFHPEADGTCHVYVLHPPGGVAGGDRLDMRFEVGAGARAVLTTPAATKFYRSAGPPAAQSCSIVVKDRAVCEYLPQETILFDGVQAVTETRVSLADHAVYVGWDIVCLGRPAAGERFRRGGITQRASIWRDGSPIWIERFSVSGDSPALSAPFGLAGCSVFATMVASGGAVAGAAERVRRAVGERGDARFAVTELAQAVVCRYLGRHADEARALFILAWDVLRQGWQGKPAALPRIWTS